MESGSYRIVDEPAPTGMASAAVDPMWPLFAVMFGGAWLAWPWFIFNAFAIGSPTRRREAMLAAAGLAGTIGVAMLFGLLIATHVLHKEQTWLALLAITLWKLGVSYWLFAWQRRTFELYQYFGGVTRNGVLVVVAAAFVKPTVLGLVPGFWKVILG
jgi:hypothetical protein